MVLPAHDGLVGVLPGHAPMLCELGVGLLRYHDINGKEQILFVAGGFGHIRENEITILTNEAIPANEITEDQADNELQRAEDMPMTTIEEVEARNAAIEHANHLVALTKKK